MVIIINMRSYIKLHHSDIIHRNSFKLLHDMAFKMNHTKSKSKWPHEISMFEFHPNQSHSLGAGTHK